MITELLAEWLPHQRWFARKDRPLTDVSVVFDTPLRTGDPGLRHLVVAVWTVDSVDRYQILLGTRGELPDRLEHAAIGECADGWAYDAAHDSELTGLLLEAIAACADHGPLRFRTVPAAVPDEGLRTDLTSLVTGAEQSNTSLAYGEDYMCKLFRRLMPGVNPELEVTAALAAFGSPQVVTPYGYVEMDLDGVPTTLAILQEFLRAAADGWSLAATSVRDCYANRDVPPQEAGGDFAGEAERLGAATARLHQELARAFPTDELAAEQLRELAAGMRARLDSAVAAVPQLAPYAGALDASFAEVAALDTPLRAQRIHGDYHLGQVLRIQDRWLVLDFEGEPGRPLVERRSLATPLRDVAGMLRSFAYAARHLLVDHPQARQLEKQARGWAERNGAAFCAGYAQAGGEDPHQREVLLRALEFDKAVYEVMYEARNRPDWLQIPLASLATYFTE